MSIVEKFAKEAQDRLTEIDDEMASKVGPLVAEKKELESTLKKLLRGTGANGNGESKVSDDQLIAAIKQHASSKPLSTKELATHLGVDPRNIARKLTKLSGDAEQPVSGDKDAGYKYAA